MLAFPQQGEVDSILEGPLGLVAVGWAPPIVPIVEFYLFHNLWKTCAKTARIVIEE
jgi:uncharacterized membrane protein